MMKKNYYLGIDIGGTKCGLVVGTERMDICDKVEFPTQVARGPEAIIKMLLKHATNLVKKMGERHLQSIGISCGGPLDSKKGVILSPPNLPRWDEIPLAGIFRKKFGVSTYLQNDANAGTLAEWKYGAGRGYDNIIFLTFGTGLGAGLNKLIAGL